MKRFKLIPLALVATLVCLAAPGARAAAATCASTTSSGGDWPMYSQNLANTRNQADEHTIDASNAGNLAAKWVFSSGSLGDVGAFQTTPVVAGGCVYMTTGSGYVYALNADTGQLVWANREAQTVEGNCCGATLFAPTYHDGVLYVDVSSEPSTATDHRGPFALALNAETGETIWVSQPVATEPDAFTNASAVYVDGMLFFGISGQEGGLTNAGGWAILDASNGDILARTHTVPTEDFAAGYGGGSVWTTAAVDPSSMYAYVGTGQPATEPKEDPYTNAILKIDIAKARDLSGNPIESPLITNPNFAQVVAAAKGTPDDTIQGVYVNRNAQAPCAQLGVGCTGDDYDFAASPTLYRDSLGHQMVAEEQKSGVLHAAYTKSMEFAWSDIVSAVGSPQTNYSTAAFDGKNLYEAGAAPGQLFSIGAAAGGFNWVSPDGPTEFDANPITYANGVVYTANQAGLFNAYDATTGAPLVSRQMSADTQSPCLNQGGGVAVARHIVYAVCGEQAGTGTADFEGTGSTAAGYLIAYALP